MNNSQLLDVIHFATLAHKDQFRKAANRTNIPYIVHPIEVCKILEDILPPVSTSVWSTSHQRDRDDMLSAAILHDVLEDCKHIPEIDLRNRFGIKVLNLVKEVTDDKNLEKMERKRLQVLNGPKKSISAKCIKVADKTSNLRDVLRVPPGWTLEGTEAYTNHAREVVNAMNFDNSIHPPLIAVFWQASQDVLDWVAEQKSKVKVDNTMKAES